MKMKLAIVMIFIVQQNIHAAQPASGLTPLATATSAAEAGNNQTKKQAEEATTQSAKPIPPLMATALSRFAGKSFGVLSALPVRIFSHYDWGQNSKISVKPGDPGIEAEANATSQPKVGGTTSAAPLQAFKRYDWSNKTKISVDPKDAVND
jgi:hypothetical protein